MLPPHDPAAALLRGARDGHDGDALADALLNPREQPYSVPALFDLIDRNGFVLGRWQMQAPYLPQCGAIATTPHGMRISALPEREQYAAMELWRGTIAHHTAVLYRSDSRLTAWSLYFDPRHVPIRLASTLCVRERLPAGAAAALLNRGHLQHDLVVPIDADEKRMLDAIDGRARLRGSWRWPGVNACGRAHKASSRSCGGTTRWCSTRRPESVNESNRGPQTAARGADCT